MNRLSPPIQREPFAQRGMLIEVVGPPGSGKTRTIQQICAAMPPQVRTCSISNESCHGTALLLGGLPHLAPQLPRGHPARRMLFGAALVLLNAAATTLLGAYDVVIAEHHVGFYLGVEQACGRAIDIEWVAENTEEPDVTLLLNRAPTARIPGWSADDFRLSERIAREFSQLAGRSWARINAEGRPDDDVAADCVLRIMRALLPGAPKR